MSLKTVAGFVPRVGVWPTNEVRPAALPNLEPLSHFPTCPDHISELPGWTGTNLASRRLTQISSNQPPQASGAAARKKECDCSLDHAPQRS